MLLSLENNLVDCAGVWIVVSRAFQVLSDPQKRQDYDKFGGDPDARGGGEGRGGGASPFGGGFPMHSGFAGEEISPEDLFNMFFGGVSPFGGGFQGGGGPFGEFVRFGGPGIRVQTFGGGTPRRRRPPPESSAGGAAHQHPQQPEAEASFRSTVIQLLPLIFLFFIPLLSSLFSDLGTGYSSTAKRPEYRFEEIHPFTKMRTTPRHHIPYWVSPRELKEFSMTDKKLREMDKRVETIFVSNLQKDCKTEMIQQQREIEDASGWFWEDVDASKKAREKVLISCMRLRELGEGRLMG